ncbi:MAG: TIGR03752 family integrating conjugative element protein [Pseudomonadales bacterium]|nr:TIGR03752 family integrating conjugative element protein [Pseudomonadales bacterium]
MKSNIVIKFSAVVIVAVLLVVILKARKENIAPAPEPNRETEVSGLSAIESGPAQEDNGLSIDPLQEEFLEEEYGVDVDSPVETMRTLTNETRAVREDSEKLQEENKQFKQEIEKLLKMEDNLNKRVSNRISDAETQAEEKQRELERTQDLTRGLLSDLKRRLDELQNNDTEKGGKQSAYGYDIGNAGIPTGLGYDENGVSVDFDQIVWTNPIDANVDPRDPTKISLPDFTTVDANLPALTRPTKGKQDSKEERSIKAYTIPINGTLIGSVSMTAMLGRIPINGQVIDPYPFKVMVGEDNLSSNGIHIPGVTGIKMSGIAKGDWTLSCVSGQITSMTFTFQDGTIVTFPEPGTKTTDPIAWFSDRNGIPCITGQRITNAATYLTSRIGLTAAASYANAEAASQFTNQTNSNGGSTSTLTGNPTIVAKNTAISEGLNEVTDWLDARQENSFDAIYVRPGTELAIHISEELRIDYDPEGRKVNHYAKINRRSEHHLD